MSSRSSRTVYVGNLPGDIREKEVEDLFYKVTRCLLIHALCIMPVDSPSWDVFILKYTFFV